MFIIFIYFIIPWDRGNLFFLPLIGSKNQLKLEGYIYIYIHTHLKGDNKKEMVEISNFSSPVVQFYTLTPDSALLHHIQDIQLTSPIWDSCFDRKGQFWLLQKQEGDTIKMYCCQKTNSGAIKVKSRIEGSAFTRDQNLLLISFCLGQFLSA